MSNRFLRLLVQCGWKFIECYCSGSTSKGGVDLPFWDSSWQNAPTPYRAYYGTKQGVISLQTFILMFSRQLNIEVKRTCPVSLFWNPKSALLGSLLQSLPVADPPL